MTEDNNSERHADWSRVDGQTWRRDRAGGGDQIKPRPQLRRALISPLSKVIVNNCDHNDIVNCDPVKPNKLRLLPGNRIALKSNERI